MHSAPAPRDLTAQIVDIQALYTFHEPIGKGYTGTVYRCTEIKSQENRAIKVIRSQEIENFNEYRLYQWIETMKEADMEGFTKFEGVFADSTRRLYYVVAKYYPGGSLQDLIQQDPDCLREIMQGSSSPEIFHRLASSLAFAHDCLQVINTTTRGVALGSLSASNVLFDVDLSMYILPGIGAALGWCTKSFLQAGSLLNEAEILAPEMLSQAIRHSKVLNTDQAGPIRASDRSRKPKFRQPSSSMQSCAPVTGLQKSDAQKTRLMEPTRPADCWALGCLFLELATQQNLFSDNEALTFPGILQGSTLQIPENTLGAQDVVERVIRGLLVTNLRERMTAAQAATALSQRNTVNRINSVTDSVKEDSDASARLNTSIHIAHLKYTISSMDESLSKLSTMLLNSVHAHTEAVEEASKLLHDKKELERDIQIKDSMIQQLKAETRRLVANTRIDIMKASSVDTDKLTTDELTRLESECRSTLDKIAKSRLIRCSPECVICLSRPKNLKFDPCKHVCVCKECYIQLEHKRCPICRATVTHVEKVFL